MVLTCKSLEILLFSDAIKHAECFLHLCGCTELFFVKTLSQIIKIYLNQIHISMCTHLCNISIVNDGGTFDFKLQTSFCIELWSENKCY